MPTPFSSDDLGRVFDARTLTRGRSLVLTGAVEIALEGDTITAAVTDLGARQSASLTPSPLGRKVVFASRCSCARPACAHLAAAALAALDRYPALRKAQQQSFLDALVATPDKERQRIVLELAPGTPPFACFVSTLLEGEKTGRIEGTTARKLILDTGNGETIRALARLLEGGDETRAGVSAASVPAALRLLVQTGKARWHATGKRLIPGEERAFDANKPPALPPKSAVILGDTGPWYVDAATGAVGRVQLRAAAPVKPAARRFPPPLSQRAPEPAPRRVIDTRPPRRADATAVSDRVILERPLTPVLRLHQLDCPDDFGRMQRLDALTLDFDYDGGLTHADDERQFVRWDGPDGARFVRRDQAREAAALEALRQDGFVQMRISEGPDAKGRRVFLFRGRDAAERWQAFVADRVPVLQAQGWRSLIDHDFGPRLVESVGVCDVRIADAEHGDFSLELGIEIDGTRQPLLPILSRLLERGGFDAAQIVDGELITSLDDGRILKLPADRMRRLLATMGDLIEAARRTADGALLLPASEAPALLDLEDLLTARWQNAAAIEEYAARFRDGPAEIPSVALPEGFATSLRPYQQQGLDWLQHLQAHGLAGILADDMGLGKTAQTIAHIAVEAETGRLDRPALVVVPTSLVANWTAELTKFAPHLKVVVLHGLDRHERRERLDGIHVVVTTYTVLARDIDAMKLLPWHLVVLDESQAIKSPDAKATRAVCQLDTRHRLCLSGTPIENNLQELWSQFAFLMPGLLGNRKSFGKRFRTPIEKKGDPLRRVQLARRIKPFILRRTKSAVATELPPKHTILRRIVLAPEQRELYETIRATLHEKVREEIAARSLAQSRIVVLDALLKLRQVCCDPRLVKLPSARLVEGSSKLDDLMEMLEEMIPEGRRILLFSQFTSMLDLIKPRVAAANIPFVELRGDTRDRAEPIRAFEACEVPLFLISLKAGGRGLNLVAADTVIHYDPWWNPAVEDQASDRAHRIGQTKSVFVYKLIAADTVEERILELQQRKAALANIALSGEEDLAALDFDEIDFLFGTDAERRAA